MQKLNFNFTLGKFSQSLDTFKLYKLYTFTILLIIHTEK